MSGIVKKCMQTDRFHQYILGIGGQGSGFGDLVSNRSFLITRNDY